MMTRIFNNQKVLPDRLVIKIFTYCGRESLLDARLVARSWLNAVYAYFERKSVLDTVLRRCLEYSGIAVDEFDCEKLSGGMTNMTFKVTVSQCVFVVRMPGKETDQYINRGHEYLNARIASSRGINPQIIFYDMNNGTQITSYLESPVPMNRKRLRSPEYISAAAHAMKQIHECGEDFANDVDVFTRNQRMHTLAVKDAADLIRRYSHANQATEEIGNIFSGIRYRKAPCHNDTTPTNFIISKARMHLIDWEYSGNNFAVWDLVCLAMEANFNQNQLEQLFRAYYQHFDPVSYFMFMLLTPVYEYWVALWASVQLANANHVGGAAALIAMEEQRFNNCMRLLDSPLVQRARRFFCVQEIDKPLPGMFASGRVVFFQGGARMTDGKDKPDVTACEIPALF